MDQRPKPSTYAAHAHRTAPREELESKYSFRSLSLPNAQAHLRAPIIRWRRSRQSEMRPAGAAHVGLPKVFSISHRAPARREPARFDPAPRPRRPEPAPLQLALAHLAKRTWARAPHPPSTRPARSAPHLREEPKSKTTYLGARRCPTPKLCCKRINRMRAKRATEDRLTAAAHVS